MKIFIKILLGAIFFERKCIMLKGSGGGVAVPKFH